MAFRAQTRTEAVVASYAFPLGQSKQGQKKKIMGRKKISVLKVREGSAAQYFRIFSPSPRPTYLGWGPQIWKDSATEHSPMQGAHPRQQLMGAPVSGNTHIQGPYDT